MSTARPSPEGEGEAAAPSAVRVRRRPAGEDEKAATVAAVGSVGTAGRWRTARAAADDADDDARSNAATSATFMGAIACAARGSSFARSMAKCRWQMAGSCRRRGAAGVRHSCVVGQL